MKAKDFKSLILKRFSIDTEILIISPNPETTALHGDAPLSPYYNTAILMQYFNDPILHYV